MEATPAVPAPAIAVAAWMYGWITSRRESRQAMMILGWMLLAWVGPFRPSNQDPKLRNLFFVGASTQPGTGLPMVLLSARLVTERVEAWANKTEPVSSLSTTREAAA